MPEEKRSYDFDIVIIGGGVLGVSIYYWLTRLTEGKIALVEKESRVAYHTSSRNTGVIHRPFYLDPVKKPIQARSAGISYQLWRDLARVDDIPWNQCGTVEVIMDEKRHEMLEKYERWSHINGLQEDDFSILSGPEVSRIEPEVVCKGAIHSKTDVSTDFGMLTEALFNRSGSVNGKVFLDTVVQSISETSNGCTLKILQNGSAIALHAGYVINAAGGAALDLAHKMGYAGEYSVLFFRGEYWRVSGEYRGKISRNIYTVPRHTKYPFLDPHFIIRSDGRREIGPNAVLVAGPEVYSGLSNGDYSVIRTMLDSPLEPKIRLIFNREFMSLVSTEWRSSLYKSEMAERVRKFIPSMDLKYLTERGVAGVRASLIDRNGFVPEAVTVKGESVLHILNYNSPGATGAPAYAAYIVQELLDAGILNIAERSTSGISDAWDFNMVSSYVSGI